MASVVNLPRRAGIPSPARGSRDPASGGSEQPGPASRSGGRRNALPDWLTDPTMHGNPGRNAAAQLGRGGVHYSRARQGRARVFFLRYTRCTTLAQLVEAFGPHCTMREILSARYHQRIFMWARGPRRTSKTSKRQPVAPQDQSAASGAAPPCHPAFQATARAGGSQAGGSPSSSS